MRALAAALAAIAVVALGASACQRAKRRAPPGSSSGAASADLPAREPRFLYRRKVDGKWRPFIESASGGEAVPVLSDLEGGLFSVAGLEQGAEALFAILRDPGDKEGVLWRLDTQPSPHAVERIGLTSGSLFGASADGNVLLLLEELGRDRQQVWLVGNRDLAGRSLLLDVRATFSGDVSADGARAVIAYVPTRCAESWIGKCPFDLVEVDLTGPAAVLREAERHDSRSSYQPRFVPGRNDRYGYQTTQFDRDDVACARGVNECRHDLVERSFTPKDAASLVRPELRFEQANGPYYSPRGDVLAYATIAGTRCKLLPCDAMSLFVADRAADGDWGPPRKLIDGDVHQVAPRWWSPDGRFLAYRGTGDGQNRPIKIVSLDGKLARVVNGEHAIGWVR